MGVVLLLGLFALLGLVNGVDRSKFRTCETSSFCRRHRGVSSEPELRVVLPSVRVDGKGVVTAELSAAVPGSPPFELSLQAFATGAVRMRVLERGDMPPRWEVRVRFYQLLLGCHTHTLRVSLLPTPPPPHAHRRRRAKQHSPALTRRTP